MCKEPKDSALAENGLPDLQASYSTEEKKAVENPIRTDTLRSWLVCAVCAIAFCDGSVGFRCSGLLLVSISTEFDIPKGQAAWPSSITNLCTYFTGIVVGPLAQKYPLKPLVFMGMVMTGLGFVLGSVVPNLGMMTIFFGAMHGSGLGILLVACNTLLTQYFDRFRGLASGIAHSSSPVASMIFPPLMSYVEKRYGFRYAMLTIGIILMSTAPLALMVNDAPWVKKNSTTSGHKGKMFAWSIFREPMFYILLAPNLAFPWCFDSFMATVVDFGSQKGLSMEDILLVLACYSMADIIGRIFFPAMADWGWLGRDTLLTLSYFVSCAFLLLLCVCSSLWHFIATVSLLGGFFGLCSSYYFSMIARYLGSERLPFILGMMGTFGGLVFLMMPAAIGFFKDELNDYRLMYLMNAVLLFLTSLPLVGVVYRRKVGRSLEVAE